MNNVSLDLNNPKVGDLEFLFYCALLNNSSPQVT